MQHYCILVVCKQTSIVCYDAHHVSLVIAIGYFILSRENPEMQLDL